MEHIFSYSLADFLPFAPETYFRLFERLNDAFWPLQVPLFALCLLILWLGVRQRGLRILAVLFAAAWLLVAWAFFWVRYQSINWAGSSFALAAVLQAALMLQFAVWPSSFSRRGRRAALFLMAFAFLLVPLIGPLSGRAWQGMELFALSPDPTAVASVGFVLLVSGWRRWLILPIALSWCLVTAASAYAMDWSAGMIGPGVAVAMLLLGFPLQARSKHQAAPR